jgi:nucleoside-diphosphate-sugar epimerase
LTSTALVTGCAGFIGSHLTESLLGDGHAVVGVDCFNDNYGRAQKLRNLEQAREWERFEFVPLDLAFGELVDLVEDCDTIFHLAAEPGVRSSWGERFAKYVRNNVAGTQHLLDAARRCPGKRLVFASSSSIYGQARTLPTHEDVVPMPHSPYGVTKLAAEHLCQAYHANYGVDAVILRYFSVYGPRQRPDMAFNIFSRAVADGEAITVFGDGNQTRDFTFVDDVVSATRLAAQARDPDPRVFNVGGGSHITLRSALELIEQFAGRKLDVRYVAREAGDVRDTLADVERSRDVLGFTPDTAFEDGLLAEFRWVVEGVGAGR